jgi:hypothetical protein
MQPKTMKSKNNIFIENGRQPQFFLKKEDLIFSLNGRQPHRQIMQSKQLK